MAEGGAASTSKVSSTKKRIETDADFLFFFFLLFVDSPLVHAIEIRGACSLDN